jgi:hypothetical protein
MNFPVGAKLSGLASCFKGTPKPMENIHVSFLNGLSDRIIHWQKSPGGRWSDRSRKRLSFAITVTNGGIVPSQACVHPLLPLTLEIPRRRSGPSAFVAERDLISAIPCQAKRLNLTGAA